MKTIPAGPREPYGPSASRWSPPAISISPIRDGGSSTLRRPKNRTFTTRPCRPSIANVGRTLPEDGLRTLARRSVVASNARARRDSPPGPSTTPILRARVMFPVLGLLPGLASPVRAGFDVALGLQSDHLLSTRLLTRRTRHARLTCRRVRSAKALHQSEDPRRPQRRAGRAARWGGSSAAKIKSLTASWAGPIVTTACLTAAPCTRRRALLCADNPRQDVVVGPIS